MAHRSFITLLNVASQESKKGRMNYEQLDPRISAYPSETKW